MQSLCPLLAFCRLTITNIKNKANEVGIKVKFNLGLNNIFRFHKKIQKDNPSLPLFSG